MKGAFKLPAGLAGSGAVVLKLKRGGGVAEKHPMSIKPSPLILHFAFGLQTRSI